MKKLAYLAVNQSLITTYLSFLSGVTKCHFVIVNNNNKEELIEFGNNIGFGSMLGLLTEDKICCYLLSYDKFSIILLCKDKDSKQIIKNIEELYREKQRLHKKIKPSKSKSHQLCHEFFGQINNYPDCCIQNYINLYANGNSKYASISVAKDYLSKVKGKEKFGINIENKRVSLGKLGYIPCSPHCKESLNRLKKANKYLNYVRRSNMI